MFEFTKTLLWIVCAVMTVGMAGTVWGQEGKVEFGGAAECPNEDCKADGGGDVEIPGEPGGGYWTDERNYMVLVPHSGDGDLSATSSAIGEIFEALVPDYVPEIIDLPGLSTVSFRRMHTVCNRESGAAISRVGVENNKAGLYAKIRKVSDLPMGGGATVAVQLNRRLGNPQGPIEVPTIYGSIAQTNADLITAIRQAGYRVVETAHYIIVTQDLHPLIGPDLNQVSFYTTDPGIMFSEVALEDDTLDSTKCVD